MSFFHKPCKELENKLENFFLEIQKVNKEKYNGCISIILLGSLSRGEGSWDFDANGNIRMLSDIEFFNVVPDKFDRFKEYEEDVNDIIQKFFRGNNSVLFHIDNSYTTYSALHKLERKVLIFDARELGKTVVGEDRISCLPRVTIENINYFDIRDILVHRIFSVLYYGLKMKNAGDLSGYKYSLAKNSLDLMTVYLAEKKVIVSGFSNKLEMTKKLSEDSKLNDYFEYCLKVKYHDFDKDEYSVEEMERIFIDLIVRFNTEFKIPIRNVLVNIFPIARRMLGILKRGIRKGKVLISQKKHLSRLINEYNNKKLEQETIDANYVLNGYPEVNK